MRNYFLLVCGIILVDKVYGERKNTEVQPLPPQLYYNRLLKKEYPNRKFPQKMNAELQRLEALRRDNRNVGVKQLLRRMSDIKKKPVIPNEPFSKIQSRPITRNKLKAIELNKKAEPLKSQLKVVKPIEKPTRPEVREPDAEKPDAEDAELHQCSSCFPLIALTIIVTLIFLGLLYFIIRLRRRFRKRSNHKDAVEEEVMRNPNPRSLQTVNKRALDLGNEIPERNQYQAINTEMVENAVTKTSQGYSNPAGNYNKLEVEQCTEIEAPSVPTAEKMFIIPEIKEQHAKIKVQASTNVETLPKSSHSNLQNPFQKASMLESYEQIKKSSEFHESSNTITKAPKPGFIKEGIDLDLPD